MRTVFLFLSALWLSASAANKFVQHNLVSDLPGVADHVDTNLVNPWGISASKTGPFWISNNGTGTTTLYNGSGIATPATKPLVVTIPAASGGTSSPTGQVFNEAGSGFEAAAGKPSSFLFSGEDGTITGWNSGVNNGVAVVLVNKASSGAVYKGLAYAQAANGARIYAANFNNGKVESYDSSFTALALPFADAAVPAGYAPFGIQVLNGQVYVAYAKQDSAKKDDVPGVGNGYVAVFDLDGNLVKHLVSGGQLDSPWGLAIAPAGFGDFAGALLVGNFGDGRVNAYNATSGSFLGTLADANGKPIAIEGLWALRVGNGGTGGDAKAVYFTAGISGGGGAAIESHGLFGAIQAAPAVSSSSFVNGASFQPGLAGNTWMTVTGSNLAATTRGWGSADFVNGALPTKLDGVSVTVNGTPAYVEFVSPSQLNVLLPVNSSQGTAQIVVSNNGLAADAASVSMGTFAPALFLFDATHIAATHANGSLIGPTTLFPNASTPASTGETITLYGTGLGPTNPAAPEGQLVTSALNLVSTPTVLFGSTAAVVQFAGISATGLYQINVVVPAGLATGDVPVVVQLGGTSSPATATLNILAVDVTPPSPAPYAATIDNFAFAPPTLTISGSGKVTWTNQQSGVPHTVVSDTGAFSSATLSAGQTFSTTLTKPGTYTYHCSIHPFMTGKIVVQ